MNMHAAPEQSDGIIIKRACVLRSLAGTCLALLLLILCGWVLWQGTLPYGVQEDGGLNLLGPEQSVPLNTSGVFDNDAANGEASLLEYVSVAGDVIMFSENQEERKVLLLSLQGYLDKSSDVQRHPATRDGLREAMRVLRMATRVTNDSPDYSGVWSACKSRIVFLANVLRNRNSRTDDVPDGQRRDAEGPAMYLLLGAVFILLCVAMSDIVMWRRIYPLSSEPMLRESVAAEGAGRYPMDVRQGGDFVHSPCLCEMSDRSAEGAGHEAADEGPCCLANVLLVEDSPLSAEITMRVLLKAGAGVTHAESGIQALEHAAAGSYSLILLDLFMPGMDGYETTRRLRTLSAEYARVPIMALTASEIDMVAEQCRLAGITDILRKPLVVADMMTALERGSVRESPDAGEVVAFRPVTHDGGSSHADVSCAGTAPGIKGGSALSLLPLLDGSGSQKCLEISRDEYVLLISSFLVSLPTYMKEVEKAREAFEYGILAELIHRLKGESANVGAVRIYESATVLERRLRDNPAADIDVPYQEFMHFLRELSKLRPEDI